MLTIKISLPACFCTQRVRTLGTNDQRAQLIWVEKMRDHSQCDLCPHHRKTSSERGSSAVNNLNFDTPKLIIFPTCLNTELNHNNTAKSYHSES